ncbi:MAG: site-specific integrase [gamma proteobacterium symbiont of Bathyaustriella thionipta]|nr:site-specific integrase [gamma proteobacterium symbiont of Bathyaustriella thionipta]MCU7953137.1 site-specific integrase [gamma proteobacterium symbiont of Bathyaustriella thionipta]MCU7966016.1 site-specific integrase [gamma proteobacterium symbiont of Bathyaustriella thionipta]
MTNVVAPQSVSFATLVQMFFTEYLISQRAMSPCTIASYRDSMMLFLDFTRSHIGKAPTNLEIEDINPALILAFLNHLEKERHNTVRSRNLRLAALRAFLKYAGRQDVSSLQAIEQALSVPMKHFKTPMLDYLSREEMMAVLGQPGKNWTSKRDHLLISMLYNTGARVSEIIKITIGDVILEGAAFVHLHGKGRKERSMPLWKSTAQEIRGWLKQNPDLDTDSALLPNRNGESMTRFNVTKRLNLAVEKASHTYKSLSKKRISPHTIRHTTAMHLLQAGVDFSVIALWLGHESATTTHRYVEANLAMKQQALERLQETSVNMSRYSIKDDELIQFLQSL